MKESKLSSSPVRSYGRSCTQNISHTSIQSRWRNKSGNREIEGNLDPVLVEHEMGGKSSSIAMAGMVY
jgi:hypothetical protein